MGLTTNSGQKDRRVNKDHPVPVIWMGDGEEVWERNQGGQEGYSGGSLEGDGR